MKLLFVSRLFHGVSGGIERMAITMMNELVARGHTVELLSWDGPSAETHYPLDANVVWHKLDMGNANVKAGWMLRARRQWAIRRLLARIRPDAMIAFQHGPFLTVAVSALGLGIPIIAAERNAPQRFDHLRAGKIRGLIFQTFRLADCITVQLQDYVAGYPGYLRGRIVSIPNPVRPATVLARPEGLPGARFRLLSVGRLSYQKNQSTLLEAFSRISAIVPDWQLVLVGAGEDEARLRTWVKERGLTERVVFTGAVRDVDTYYQEGHLFCLASRWEGFPNALAEAMAHGLPAVGFAECAGVGQLISHGRTGLLAEGNGSPESLAACLLTLMQDAERRKIMGREAVAAMAPFLPGHVHDQWESTFKQVAARR
ncbi:MAG: glycosyltransferase family 4 protein [Pseudomonadota bacterium]